ncbi:TPA: MFS transporter [Pseudomonas putida]|uniref:MFS transporter n=1 Tax=Pseudomonas putida TaxID=303 RepID=UPI00110CE0C6|nr:MFS transporter [Pseudomonas putida]MDD1991414.1 MFS transporter [Pseudomonas putida]HDS0918860.1 MFS transporter [Pseudomonas putida]HDS0934405.1 MFS transporter [Pseudomonas putida]HDS1781448.1 MFS transporter [Pseudomonas putida]HDS3799485.1 MFS transporter [Pseudomonas putida]
MKFTHILLLAGLSMLGPLGIDMYLPAMPTITEQMRAASWLVQLSLSAYLVGLAAMMLVYGALSDRVGRRPVLLWSTAAFSLCSLAVACSQNAEQLLLFRVLQGLSAGAGGVVGRALIQDTLQGPAAMRAMSQVIMAFVLAPAIAPLLGGYLLDSLGWRAVFLAQAGFAAALFAWALVQLGETLQPAHRVRLGMRAMGRTYLAVARDAQYQAMVLAGSLTFMIFSLYIGAAAWFVLQVLALQVTEFGWVFIPLVAGAMLGAAVSARQASRWSRSKQMLVGYGLMLTASACNCAYFICTDSPQVPFAVLALALTSLAFALLNPCICLMAVERHAGYRGMANSLLSFEQTLFFAAVTAFLCPALEPSATALAAALFVAVLLSGVIMLRSVTSERTVEHVAGTPS